MKRFLIALLAILILCCGCSFGENSAEEAVQFYYLRNPDNFLYGASDGVVTCEYRDSTGHSGNIRYLLTLYLQGPVDDGLESPFPAGCSLVELKQTETEITVKLNASLATLKGMDLTLACVCLARTCICLADVDTVHILAQSTDGKIAVDETITIDSLLLEDNMIPSETGQ